MFYYIIYLLKERKSMSLDNFVYESVSDLLENKYDDVNERIEKHKDLYHDDTAICFSLLSLSAFLKEDYNQGLLILRKRILLCIQ